MTLWSKCSQSNPPLVEMCILFNLLSFFIFSLVFFSFPPSCLFLLLLPLFSCFFSLILFIYVINKSNSVKTVTLTATNGAFGNNGLTVFNSSFSFSFSFPFSFSFSFSFLFYATLLYSIHSFVYLFICFCRG